MTINRILICVFGLILSSFSYAYQYCELRCQMESFGPYDNYGQEVCWTECQEVDELVVTGTYYQQSYSQLDLSYYASEVYIYDLINMSTGLDYIYNTSNVQDPMQDQICQQERDNAKENQELCIESQERFAAETRFYTCPNFDNSSWSFSGGITGRIFFGGVEYTIEDASYDKCVDMANALKDMKTIDCRSTYRNDIAKINNGVCKGR